VEGTLDGHKATPLTDCTLTIFLANASTVLLSEHQSINPSIQSINQSINQIKPNQINSINQINQSINQSINPSILPSINQ